MTSAKSQIAELLFTAANSRFGIRVAVSNASRFKNRFYKFRKELINEGYEEYSKLTLINPAREGEFFIAKR